MHRIDATEFLRVVRPPLERGNCNALADAIRTRWHACDVARLLLDDDLHVRQTAAVALAVVGEMRHCYALARALHDDDLSVNQMAEYALSNIWCRAGGAEASKPFCEGINYLGDEQYELAASQFAKAIAINSEYAEAHHHHGTTLSLLGETTAAMHAHCAAFRRIRCHFQAVASVGHCYAELGDIMQAVRCYRHALRINPNMPVIAAALDEIESNGSWDLSAEELATTSLPHLRQPRA